MGNCGKNIIIIEIILFTAFFIFIFNALISREKILKYLSNNFHKIYKENYKKIKFGQILFCDFSLIKVLLKNEIFLLHKIAESDNNLKNIQGKYKFSLVASGLICLVFFVLPFLLFLLLF